MSGVGSFSGRARAYDAGRPPYPATAVRWAIARGGLARSSAVADIGAGTGLLTRRLATEFERVFAIEPNSDMRAHLSGSMPTNVSVLDSQAERTGLPDRSVDAVFVGQALHWFDAPSAVSEWRRILNGARTVAVLWNDRRVDDDAVRALDKVLQRHAITDTENLGHRARGRQRTLDHFKAAGVVVTGEERFPNDYLIDIERLEPFLGSVSYLPEPTSPGFQSLLTDAAAVLRGSGNRLRLWETVVQILAISER